jgi:ferrous iron transport protein A
MVISCPTTGRGAPESLTDLQPGERATVVTLDGEPRLLQRLCALGIRPGQTIRLLRQAAWGGPLHLRVGMTELMLRRQDARHISIAPLT